ncbi:MAG TPA: hypothetical protein VID71_02950 [Steroidobacteraceae bacterium]
MSAPSTQTSERRAVLRQRCALQREELADAADAVQARLRSIDRGFGALRKIRLAPTLFALLPMILAAVPAFRRVSRALAVVNGLRRLLPSR